MSIDLLAAMAQLMSLPEWLLAPLQAENFIEALRLHVSELASDEWLILYCGIKRFLLKDDSGYWEGTYNLGVKSSSTGVEQTVLLHGRLTAPWLGKPVFTESNAPFGSPDWHGFLPEFNLALETEPPEKELPGLAHLTDSEQSRLLIEKIVRESGRLAAGDTITACKPRILSYKPGSRCTIRYDLEYAASPDPSRRSPQLLIGKVYRKGSKAQNAYEGMMTLWHSPLADGSVVTIAEPIACLPDLKLMLQATIPGELSLEDLLKSVIDRPNQEEDAEKLYHYLRKTAAGLAAFHRSGALYGEHIELGERFADLHELIHRLTVLLPQFEGAVLPLLERLENLAVFYPEEPAVPTHGTFNPEQVLIDGERIGFIDFDDYCMAEPALDVGLFRAAIKDTGMNARFSSSTPSREERLSRLTLLDEMGDVFLTEYETHASISRHRVALWEAADYLRNCLHFWIKVKPAEPDTALLILEQHLQNCQKNHLLELAGP